MTGRHRDVVPRGQQGDGTRDRLVDVSCAPFGGGGRVHRSGFYRGQPRHDRRTHLDTARVNQFPETMLTRMALSRRTLFTVGGGLLKYHRNPESYAPAYAARRLSLNLQFAFYIRWLVATG